MDCSNTLAVSNEHLLSVVYNEGTLTEEERAHLEQCPTCQQRLTSYARTNALLRSKLYRRLCPDAVQLNYYCLGVVPEEQRINIASHVLDCPLCADEVAQIRREQAAFEPFPRSSFSLHAVAHRLFATLVVQQAQPVTREMTPSTGWPRQYRAETIDVSLHLSRAANGEMMLLGIITSVDPNEAVDAFEGQKVDLYLAPGPLATEGEDAEAILPSFTTEVDDVGNIVLEDIQPGNYVLILHLPDREVIVEGLNIDQA